MERTQRTSSEHITITISSDNQKLPVDLDMCNKVRLQKYVFKWMLQNVESDKAIFLVGCDSTSKVGPKVSGLKASMDLSLLEGFGVEELSPQMTSNAEKFLVSGLKTTDCSTFDEYLWEQYHNSKKELDFNQLPKRYKNT